MATRNLNKVMLIGNLTREPELRYTPQGTAVASFVVATNREWTDQATGERKQVADFHNCVSWNKLAEICSQLLKKGTKVYVEGRLQTRDWVGTDGNKRYKTEVVVDDMIVLKQPAGYEYGGGSGGSYEPKEEEEPKETEESEDIDLDDLDLDAVLEEVEAEADAEVS